MAVELLKRVAERGEGDRGLTLAKRAFEGLDHHAALMQYLRLSAMGVGVAQSNAAWMLKHGYGYALRLQISSLINASLHDSISFSAAADSVMTSPLSLWRKLCVASVIRNVVCSGLQPLTSELSVGTKGQGAHSWQCCCGSVQPSRVTWRRCSS